MLVKVWFKRIALYILSFIGYMFFLPIWRDKNKILILRYHSVGEHRRHEVNVRPVVFKKQMELICNYYNPISLHQALSYLRDKQNIPKNTVVITFDDGYRDNYTNAYPILMQLEIPVTIFLTAGYIGTDKILAHDIGDNPIYNYLLSWNQVREMAGGGIEFGSHTLAHANLVDRGVDVFREIRDSKEFIEKELGHSIFAISYPFGLVSNFNQATKEAARLAGYACGCSAMNGVNDSNTDIFELKRIGIEASDNMFTFKAKLNGALDLLVLKDKPIFNKFLGIFNKLLGV